MFTTPDDMQEKYWRMEQARRKELIPGTMVQVYMGTGGEMSRLRIVGTTVVSVQDVETKVWHDETLYQLEGPEHQRYYATAEFISKV